MHNKYSTYTSFCITLHFQKLDECPNIDVPTLKLEGKKKGSVWRWENLMLEPWEEHKNFFLKSKSIVETIKRHLKWPLEMLWLKMWWLLRLPMSVKAFHMKCSNVMIVKFWNFHIQTLTKQTVQIAYMGPLCRGKKKNYKMFRLWYKDTTSRVVCICPIRIMSCQTLTLLEHSMTWVWPAPCHLVIYIFLKFFNAQGHFKEHSLDTCSIWHVPCPALKSIRIKI